MPHLGNLIGAVLSADVFARYNRSQSRNTLFICGSDEHGTTTEAKAREEGHTPQALCNKYHQIHKSIYEWFAISFDYYGRTHHISHTQRTQELFIALHNNGYIVEEELEQLFDEQEQTYLADRFVQGTCPHCQYEQARGDQCDSCGKLLNPHELINPISTLSGTQPIIRNEQHLFLDLEKLQNKLEPWVKEQSQLGNWSENAIRTTNAWFKEGLHKRCITRNLKWGIPVPLKGWEDKVFYVWFDAPIGYISITQQLLKEAYKDWWHKPNEVKLYQFMGKDNIPFHTILFPATLIGAKQNHTLLHHINSTEYLNYETGKFSKSRQHGIFCDDAQNTNIPADSYRYYLLRNRPETSDTSFNWHDFYEKHNNELLANLANLVNRTMVFIQRYQDSTIANKPTLEAKDKAFWQAFTKKEQDITQLLEAVKLKEALKVVMELSTEANTYYQHSEPWKTIKEQPTQAINSMYLLAHVCKDLAILIEPYLPTTAKNIFDQLAIKPRSWADLGILDLDSHSIGTPQHLFAKLQVQDIEKLRTRFSGQQQKKHNKLDLRVGRITKVEQHPDADKLYIEQVDLGELGTRQIISGLTEHYTQEELLGKHVIIVANLKSAQLRGQTSQGMLLAVQDKQGQVGVITTTAAPGTRLIPEPLTQPANTNVQTTEVIDIKEFSSHTLQAKKSGIYLDEVRLVIDNHELSVDKQLIGLIR